MHILFSVVPWFNSNTSVWEGLLEGTPHTIPIRTPAGCLRIQLNSGIIYPNVALECIGWGLSPTRLLQHAISDRNHKSRLLVLLTDQLQSVDSNNPLRLKRTTQSPGCYLHFWPIAYKSEVPMIFSLCSINLLKWLTELRGTF